MSDHLPECPMLDAIPLVDEGWDEGPCICDRLIACEQRVRDESWDHGMEVGTHSALDAAREAVAAMPPMEGWKTRPVGRVDLVDKWSALAAIDALRGES